MENYNYIIQVDLYCSIAKYVFTHGENNVLSMKINV